MEFEANSDSVLPKGLVALLFNVVPICSLILFFVCKIV